MSRIEYLLIVAGVMLDVFAEAECKGSLVAKVNKKQLSGVCFLVAVYQLMAFFLGHFLAALFCKPFSLAEVHAMGYILSIIIFAGLGIRLVRKAVRNEHIVEHLEEKMRMRQLVRPACVTGSYTVLAGIAFGFLDTNVVDLLIMIAVLSVIFIIAGMYTGYHFGFEQKTKVYIIGSVLLILAGADVLVRFLLNI